MMKHRRETKRPRERQVSREKKIGASPGSLIHIGTQKVEQALVTLLAYDPDTLQEGAVSDLDAGAARARQPGVTWINVDGLHEIEVMAGIGQRFGLHPLVQEDILNTEHRPKFEDHESYLFFVLKMLSFDEERGKVQAEQVSLILGPGFVLSFQEAQGDVFDGVRERIRQARGRIRRMGADYLTYALVDAVVDNYFLILEKIGDTIELLEDDLIATPAPETLHKIHALKREMIQLRKSIWPLREVISGLQRNESALLTDATAIFFRDVYDHTVQVVETVETYRDILGGLLDLYLSSVSNRMNEVMKVLTLIATIFIPLTFLAGIYGMNFEYMPELHWRWAYPAFWGVMIVVGGALLVFFRRRRWL